MRLHSRRAAFGLIAAFGALRFAHWGAPVTGDEAYTLRHFASQGLAHIRGHYEAPNNHVLLSMALNRVDALLPRRSINTLEDLRPHQLPSLLASVGTLALLYPVACSLVGPPAALIAVAVHGAALYPLMYSHMLRGYALSGFLHLLTVWSLLQLLERRRRWAGLLGAAAFAASFYTIPSNALFALALPPWLLFVAWRAWREAPEPALLRRARGKTAARLQAALSRRLAPPLAASAALALGAILCVWAYRPIWDQVRGAAKAVSLPTYAASFAATGARLAEEAGALGGSGPSQAFALTGLALGLAGARRRRRWASAGVLALSTLAAPFVLSTLQKTVPPSRVFVPALPLAAVLCGAGFYGALAAALRASGRRVSRPALLGLAGAVLLAGAGDLRRFWTWNRGLDLRGAVVQATELAALEDDFVVVLDYREAEPRFGLLDWQYYGLSGELLPYGRLFQGAAPGHLAAGEYFVAAESPEAAAAALERSGLDRWRLSALSPAGGAGRLLLYRTGPPARAEAAAARAAAFAGLPPEVRGRALAFLGARLVRAGDAAAALAPLRRALALAPQDESVRFWLGLAHHARFDDAAARIQWDWFVARGAPLPAVACYLAETHAAEGRVGEAMRWYSWLWSPEAPPDSWVSQLRAKPAADRLKAGERPLRDLRGPEGCLRTARSQAAFAAHERALAAYACVERARPLTELEQLEKADVLFRRRDFAAAAALLERAVAAGGGLGVRAARVDALAAKYRQREARRLARELVREYPDHPHVRSLRRRLDAWWGGV